ncbi:MAG TPA: GyrI-like domain-containing protein [Candidatus Dormibacteraeota bacterium]
MPVSVTLQTVEPRTLAAVRREVPAEEIGSTWRPALDKVWDFIHSHPGLWSGGHNVFVYQRAEELGGSVRCEFGVEITGAFEAAGEVHLTETPSGDAAVAVYRGPYDSLHEAYGAIEVWMEANGREPAGRVWEIYGDPTPDPADTETTVVQLLKS